jgi:hypothetical protein
MTATARRLDFSVPSPPLRTYLASILGGLDGDWMAVAEIDPTKKPGDKGRIVHRWRRSVAQLVQTVGEADADRNLYFAHARFSERQRKDQHVVSTRILFADCDSRQAVEAVRRFRPHPSWVVRTSPGKAQAVWVVRDPASPEEMAAVTRRLGRLLGADKGVWEPSRLLRLPWTLNVKPEYGPDFPLVELEATGRAIDLSTLVSVLPPEERRHERTHAESAQVGHDVWALIDKLPENLRKIVRGLDKKGEGIPEHHRSEPFWWLVMELVEAGWGPRAMEAVLGVANDQLMGGRYTDKQIHEQIEAGFAKHREQPGTALITLRADQVPVRQVDWLWQHRVPLRKVTVFDGDPEMGKSTIMEADVAARVTKGRPMPDGAPNPFGGQPRDVVIMSAEDDADDTIVPRLMAAGADLYRVHFLEGPKDEHDVPTNLSLPSDLNKIRQACEELVRQGRQVGLVIVDPVIAFFDARVNSWNDQQSRPVLGALRVVAQDFGCAVVGIRHFRKASGAKDEKIMHRGGGTIGIIGAARAGIGVVDHPEDSELKVFGNTKSNLAPKAGIWAYKIVPAEVQVGGQVIDTSQIEWANKIEGYRDIDDLLHTPPKDEREPRTGAREWLLLSLPMRSEFMQQWAERDGYSWATVRRARTELKEAGVIDRRRVGGTEGYWEWYLVDRTERP